MNGSESPPDVRATLSPGRPRSSQRLLAACLLLFLTFAGAQQWDLRICALPNSLPYSNEAGEGFEDRIARIIARELGAEAVFVWLPSTDPRVRDMFMNDGRCDAIMGVNDGHPGFLTSLAYYRSSYVFVYREDGPVEVESLNDPQLRDLRIGVQIAGRGVSPPTLALANRGLLEQQVGMVPQWGDPQPLAHLVDAVIEGEVDLAIAWGPVAGYFAQHRNVPVAVVPVTPQIDQPFVPLVSSISIGVRPEDEPLRDALNVAIAAAWQEIGAVLSEYGIPRLPLPEPTVRSP